MLRRHGSSGYRGVRVRHSGVYYVEIRSDDVHLGLGTFDTSHEAARAYDVAAWRLGRPRAQMNFHDVYTRKEAQDPAPPPRLIYDQDRQEHRRQQCRLLVAKEDERAMAEWRRRHPEDVVVENAFWAERTARRREERQDRRRCKLLAISQCLAVNSGGTSIFTSDDERWEDAWLSTSDSTPR
ncbi:Protein TRANSPARENT TESTA 12 [Hordeum vulgare]|nr:Protein TRANSPARENT TESTA 12 [Hordeum vulgare]